MHSFLIRVSYADNLNRLNNSPYKPHTPWQLSAGIEIPFFQSVNYLQSCSAVSSNSPSPLQPPIAAASSPLLVYLQTPSSISLECPLHGVPSPSPRRPYGLTLSTTTSSGHLDRECSSTVPATRTSTFTLHSLILCNIKHTRSGQLSFKVTPIVCRSSIYSSTESIQSRTFWTPSLFPYPRWSI